MKNKLLFLLAGAAALMMTACAGAGANYNTGTEQAQAAAGIFDQAGFTVEEYTADGQKASFNVVDENGGANIRIETYSDLNQARQAYEDVTAAYTQSEYYMMTEAENEKAAGALFNNSINYVNALAILDKETGTVFQVSEIAQADLQNYLDLIAPYGLDLQ